MLIISNILSIQRIKTVFIVKIILAFDVILICEIKIISLDNVNKFLVIVFLFSCANIFGQNHIPTLNFENSRIDLCVSQNTLIPAQTVKVLASTGNPIFILSPDPDASSWLILPKKPILGIFEIKIMDSLSVGKYSTTIYAIDQPDLGYMNGELNISVEILK